MISAIESGLGLAFWAYDDAEPPAREAIPYDCAIELELRKRHRSPSDRLSSSTWPLRTSYVPRWSICPQVAQMLATHPR